AEGAANATINRELAALKRMFSLAVRGEKIHRAPHIGMLHENNVRTGFFEDHQYEAVLARLPAYAQSVVTFAYITGWRVRSEVLTLQWRQVDFKAGRVRLDPGTTKNLEGRVFVMTPELRATLEAQLAATEALQRKTAPSSRGSSIAPSADASSKIQEGLACRAASCTTWDGRRWES